ncbi:unnamed protein product [Caenorhabditis bovis]|uniref:DUF148 domain-containing protein n=1 Tax=Caenorhabditis bovis TaxID=2654633 RepID=A0A8S1ECG4_9PELO|nr:unnamed protein product [Caenorhabditis bovis]
MSKFLILLTFMVFTINAHPVPPTADEAKQELINAGVSAETADGIVSIAEKYKDQFEQGKSDREVAKAAFESFHNEVQEFIKTQPQSDQDAYNAFVEKRKAEHMQHHNHEESA